MRWMWLEEDQDIAWLSFHWILMEMNGKKKMCMLFINQQK